MGRKKILVTGATGFIGYHLVKRLVQLKFEVHVLIRNTSDASKFKDFAIDFHLHRMNEDYSNIVSLVSTIKPEYVIHLASLFIAEHRADNINELVRSNIEFGAQLLEAMKANRVRNLINTGTNWQCAGSNQYEPMNFYAATKEAFESLAKYYVLSSEMTMLTLRLYDTYGVGDERNKVLNLFRRIASTGEELVMSPGEQLIGLTHIEDVVDAYIVALEAIQNMDNHIQESYYVTPSQFFKLREVAELYKAVMQVNLNIRWGGKGYREREIMKPYVGKCLPGWSAKIRLEQGLKELYKEIL